MPKITSVEPQQKNPKRFNILLDGEFVFGADEDLVVNNRLVVGKELSASDVEQLIKETEGGKLMERMYHLFSIRARSEKEVRNYFRIKNQESRIKEKEQVSDLVIDQLVENLKRKGMINDLEFTKAWVESRSRKKGLRVIKQELFQKGIDREIIEEVISGQRAHTESGEGYSEQQTAEKLLEKKMRVWKNLKNLEFKKKAYEYLMRRGFEYEVVKEVIENLIKKM